MEGRGQILVRVFTIMLDGAGRRQQAMRGAAAGAALERAEDVERGERCCDDDVHVGFTVKRARITTQIHHRNGAGGRRWRKDHHHT